MRFRYTGLGLEAGLGLCWTKGMDGRACQVHMAFKESVVSRVIDGLR